MLIPRSLKKKCNGRDQKSNLVQESSSKEKLLKILSEAKIGQLTTREQNSECWSAKLIRQVASGESWPTEAQLQHYDTCESCQFWTRFVARRISQEENQE